MPSKRYTLTVEDHETGKIRRFAYRSRLPLISEQSDLLVAFTLSLRRVAVALLIIFGFPILFAILARWSVQTELHAAQTMARTYEIESTSYKAVTAELTGQIAALQTTVNDLDDRSQLDPTKAKALRNLPAVIRNRAMGGGDPASVRSLLSPSLPLPEDTFGMLRSLLQTLESRLESVKGDVDKRAALASATPTGWPAIGWISAYFGQREDPFNGGQAFHTGLDISADMGTPVVATGDGRIISAEYHPQYGNLLVIDHGYGMTTRYGHLAGFAVAPGAKVVKGQLVGYVGATGRATGPHLHYEILINGQAIDPLQLALEPSRHP
jgi:murein DD-endopeptidase MepM/ murein hydrolase activator NlpD